MDWGHLRQSISLFIILAMALCDNICAQEDPCSVSTRPNIVLIMVDDMGFSDLGCYGGEIETPHLDSLALNGIRFTNFYNTAKGLSIYLEHVLRRLFVTGSVE